MAALVSPAAIDRILADAEASGTPLDGEEGLFNQFSKALIDRTLGAEMDHHLGYKKDDPEGRGSGNSRNGTFQKTLLTTNGPVRIEVPRDRNGTFEPRIVPKGQRRLGQIDDMVLSLYARGMTTRDIQAHLKEVYGADVSPELVSRVTDVVTDEIAEWQNRPLDAVYVICYIDALVVKIRTDGVVRNRPVYIVTGVDLDGYKHVLGLWIGPTEGESKAYWLNVLTELRNRGVDDVLIVCCDGLTGLPEAIRTVWPNAEVQTCVIHLIRTSMKYVSYSDRKAVAAAIKPIYCAVNEQASKNALEQLRKDWGRKYPGMLASWDRAWDEFIPFLKYPKEIRKVVYTTNAIESLNYQLRKITKNRGHFPTEDAAEKLLYLGIRNITGRHIDGGGTRGTGTYGWKTALNHFAVVFGDRLPL
ncbi:IS256 family transposase [Actinopolymorpha sp. B11F2]|uniref:IS256 family transposase n=1 Tax=Actinopolymorpha sp. B11F2 TaxID=3160862 RepID=UPI0032E4B31C